MDDLVRSKSSTSLGRDCSKNGCLFNERTVIEQAEYIRVLESRVQELELKVISKSGKIQLLRHKIESCE